MSLEDRLFLEDLLRSRRTGERLRTRCHIILMALEGIPNATIATRLGVTRSMVLDWRKRFERQGLQGLLEEGPEGRLDADLRVQELRMLLDTPPPEGAAAWTVRALAREIQVSPATVQRLMEGAGLRMSPRRLGRLDLSQIHGVVDVIGFYLHSPYHTVALEVDPSLCEPAPSGLWSALRPGEAAWRLHLHLRSIEGLRQLDGRSTHYSSTFWRFLSEIQPLDPARQVWCITDTPLPKDCLEHLAFERKDLRVTALGAGTEWLEAMKIAILPALQAHLHQGRCPSLEASIHALESFLREDAQDPLQWLAGA